jgi:tRNA splicing ligase
VNLIEVLDWSEVILEFSFLFEKEVLLEFWTGLKCNPDPDIVLCNLVSEVKKREQS